jgi:peptidoglycan/xylan/chitin deacetylase (PgdA/CDA1 family)
MMNEDKRMIFSVDVDYFPGSEKGVYTLLDFLNAQNIKSTFFITGKFGEEYSGVVQKILKAGHEIGCHGYSHGLDWDENFYNIDVKRQSERISIATQILEKITSSKIKVFRAPYLKADGSTIRALESLGYECDSSVPALRFDFGMGVSNNPKTIIAPTRPYHPSLQNIFKKGNSKILEVPSSNFFIPLNTTSLRLFGVKLLVRIHKTSRTFFDPIVMITHPWEYMDTDELFMKDDLSKRHHKNRGKACLKLLQEFFDKIYKETVYLRFEQVVMEDKNG